MNAPGASTAAPGWRIAFARGLVALFLGGALLLAGAGESRLATFIGCYWLLGSVLTIRWVLRSRGIAGRRLGTLAAVIGGVTAVALLARQPLNGVIGTAALIDLVGAGAIATGAVRILGGFRDDELPDEHRHNRNTIVVGVLDAGLGVALIFTSDATSMGVRFVAAAWGLTGGTLLLVDALRIRRFAGTAASRTDHPVRAMRRPADSSKL